MDNFSIFMMHFYRLNKCKLKYSFKSIVGTFKGERYVPKPIFKEFEDTINNIIAGNPINPQFPMGVYEYNCCVEYINKIMSTYIFSKNQKKFKIVFDYEDAANGIILPPLKDCLYLVAEESGFRVIEEYFDAFGYTYTLKSIL